MLARNKWMAALQIKWIYAILAVALLIRLYYIFSNTFPTLEGDALNYDKMAKQFLETGVFGYNQTVSNAYVTPGFILIVSFVYLLFGAKLIAIQIVQVVFSVITVWVVYRIAVRFMNERYGLIAAGLMTLYPSFIYANGLLLTEVSYTLFFSLFLLVLVQGVDSGSKTALIWAGVLLGVSTLIRPTPAVLVVPLIAYFYAVLPSKKVVVRAIAYVGISSFIVVLPWWIRNYLLLDQIVLFSTSGSNPLLWGVHPYFIGVMDTFSAIYKLKPDEITRNALWAAKAKELFWSQLGQAGFIKWFVIGKLNFFWSMPWVENGEIAHLFEKLRKPLHVLLAAGGWIGLCIGVVRNHPIRLLAVIIIVYTLMHQIILPLPRYAFPIMPLMILLFTFAVKAGYEAIGKWVAK